MEGVFHHARIGAFRHEGRPFVAELIDTRELSRSRRKSGYKSANGIGYKAGKRGVGYLKHSDRQEPMAPNQQQLCCRGIQAAATPMPATKKRVFSFGKGRSEGNKSMKSLFPIDEKT